MAKGPTTFLEPMNVIRVNLSMEIEREKVSSRLPSGMSMKDHLRTTKSTDLGF
jgi:hypothetical protein